MGPFVKPFLKTIFYRRALKDVRLAGNGTCICDRWIYLLILGSMMLICELIVMRHEVHGFYVEVMKEVNTVFYIQKPPIGFWTLQMNYWPSNLSLWKDIFNFRLQAVRCIFRSSFSTPADCLLHHERYRWTTESQCCWMPRPSNCCPTLNYDIVWAIWSICVRRAGDWQPVSCW